MSGKKQNPQNEITVIVGPTSSGKTSLALELCKKTGASIISADSRQIYKHMDIGTGKVPIDAKVEIVKGDNFWLIDGVEVYGYDLVCPDDYFSGYDYAKFAREKILSLIENGKKGVVVGGTGFYIDLITNKLALTSSAPDFELRAELEKLSTEELLLKLQTLNPIAFEKIDKNNSRRVLRAVENQLSTLKQPELPALPDVSFKLYGLTAPRDFLYARVDAWTEDIWSNGLLPETQKLLEHYPNSPKLAGIIYKTVVEHLQRNLDAAEAIQTIKWDLHAYIRRQFTWFNKNKQITWLDISELSPKDCILKLHQL